MVRSCGVQIYNKRNKSAGLGVQSSTKKITWTRSTPCSILIKQNTTINLYVIIIITTTNGNTTTSSTHHHANLWTFALLNCVSAQASKLLWCVSTIGKGSKASMVVRGGGGGVAICCCCCYIQKKLSILGYLYVCKRTNSNVLEFHHGVQCSVAMKEFSIG